ncbi:MAG: DUF1036 domain-containing protein [Succinivibrio sp.]
MKKVLTALIGAMALNASALDVTIDNHTDATVVMAFSYLDNTDNVWVVDGWYNVLPKQKAVVNLDSRNDIYYLYSEFSNGKKLEGGNGSVQLQVQDRSFFYKQGKAPKTANRKVSFLRARGNDGHALIKIN